MQASISKNNAWSVVDGCLGRMLGWQTVQMGSRRARESAEMASPTNK